MSKVTTYLLVYGLSHALVDASCIILLLGGIDVREELLTYILIYNILAFGLQLPFGIIIDRMHQPVLSAVLGCIVLSLGIMLFLHPPISVILAGIGNALFHVGGGSVSLNLNRGKAALPGVFVAPGGIGLFAGGIVLKLFGFHPGICVAFLLTMGLIIYMIKSPTILYETKGAMPVNYLTLIIVLLLITVCIRSLVGLSVNFQWKSDTALLIALTAGIAFGKALGGFLADYFGWIKITISGLTLSALLLFFGSQVPVVAIIGMFLFNLTMPVCLVAISNLLPGRPGFSFGLTTFAMIAGALPSFSSFKSFFSGSSVILVMILLSTIILFKGLKLYYQNQLSNESKIMKS